MIFKSILITFSTLIFSTQAQEWSEDYIRLLIKKGIITDKLCLKQTAAGVDIILKGQAYKLGYYAANEELEQFSNGDASALATACANGISKFPNLKSNVQKTTVLAAQNIIKTKQNAFKKFISDSDPFPTEEFNRLAKFLDNYYKRASDLQELMPDEDINVFKDGAVKIKAIGYADGVRNTTEEYDPYIAKRLCEEEQGKSAEFSSDKNREEIKPLTEYFSSTVNLQTLDSKLKNHKDAFLSGWNGYNKTARDSTSGDLSAKIMSRYRNTFLAKMRADSLADKTYKTIEDYWASNSAEISTNTLLIRNSDAVISDEELNPEATYMCKGFCNMRRGAKLVLDFPLSSAKETGTPFFNSLTTHFEGPTSEDQLRMNKFAMKRLVEDYGQYIKENSDDELVKEEKKFMVEFLGKKRTPSEYQLLPLFADYECAEGTNQNCENIKDVINGYNKNSLNKFLQGIRPIIKKFALDSHFKYLIGYNFMSPVASRFIRGMIQNIKVGKRHAHEVCDTSSYRLIQFVTTPKKSKTFIDDLPEICKKKKSVFEEIFGSAVTGSIKNAEAKLLHGSSVASRESLRVPFKLNDTDFLYILLGYNSKYLEEQLENYKEILPKELIEVIKYHIKNNLDDFNEAIFDIENKTFTAINKYLNDEMTISISYLFDIGKSLDKSSSQKDGFNLSFKKNNKPEEGFFLEKFISSAPLIDYFLDLHCQKSYLNNKKCLGKNKDESYSYTKLNSPFLSMSLDNSIQEIDWHTTFLSYAVAGEGIEPGELSLLKHLSLREGFITYNDGYVRKPDKHLKSALNSYFEGAFLFNKFHFDTDVPTGGERLIANFLQKKLNIPDTLNMHYYTGKKEVKFSKDFFEYFKPLIRWTRNVLYNSIKRSALKSLESFEIKPKAMPYLNYNSEINTSHLGSEYLYPLYFANNKKIYNYDPITSIHHYLLKNYYRTGISYLLANKVSKISDNSDLKAYFGFSSKENPFDYTKSFELGYLNKSQYESQYKSLENIVNNVLKERKITNIKAEDIMVPFFQKDPKGYQHFVSQNIKAFTLIGEHAFDKIKNIEEFSKEKLDKIYDDNIDTKGLTGFSKEALRAISYMNSLFVWDSINWYNNFDQNGERYAAPYYIKKGKTVEVPKSTTNYNELKAEALREEWLKHEELAQVLSGGPSPSANGAQVSTIFSFANYSDAMADILNHVNGKGSKYKWRGKDRYKKIYRRVPENLKYIYYQPRRVQGAETDNKGEFVSGWMHIACKTGTVYPYDDKETSYHYQSRYRVQRSYNVNMKSYYNDYPSHQKYRHPYDDTFYIPNDEKVTFPIHNLVRMKRPTSYLIPNCRIEKDPCACMKKEFADGDKLDELINTGIPLNFTDNYDWIEFDSEQPYAEKRFDLDSSLKDDREIAKKVYSKTSKKTLKISGNSENYCLYSPLVPQSHEVGTGNSKDKDSLFKDSYGVEFAGSDFFIDALVGTKNYPEGASYLDGGIEYLEERIKEFEEYDTDKNIRELAGYTEKQVQDQLKYYESEINELKTLKGTDKYKVKRFDGLDDVVSDDTEIDRIYSSCIQYLNNFPMSPAMCQDAASAGKEQLKENFNWCSSLPKSVVDALGVTDQDCIQTANSIFSSGGKQLLNSQNINACRMLSKTFTDDGKVIHYNSSTKAVEKREPSTFFKKD